MRNRGLGRLGSSIAAAILFVCALFASSAQAVTFAPVDQPGPALSVPQAQLDSALQCHGTLAGHTPVLFVPGTGSDPQHNFSWNYEPALNNLGIPWCAVTLPNHALGDIQVAGEYVVNAIRTMYAAAGGKISIIGHSQGGMLPRWALRFWPDTRAMVDDDIGFAASNHGTAGADVTCASGCAAADWQQRDVANFIKALNSYQETFPGISYTEIYSQRDEIVTPNSNDTGSSSVHGGGGLITNVAIQDLCPLDPSEHLATGTQDLPAYDLAIDALTHPGPAVPSRAAASDPGICTPLALMPGINPATYPADVSNAAGDLLTNTLSAPSIPAEPPLKCYVIAGCTQTPAAGGTKGKQKKCKHRRRRKAEAAKKRGHCKKKGHRHR